MAGARDFVVMVRGRADRVPHLWTTVVLFVCTLVTYRITANDQIIGAVNDTVYAALPAWRIATEGTADISGYPTFGYWAFDYSGSLRSDRFPGAIFSAVPFYWWQAGSDFGLGPAAQAAASVSALAVATTHRMLLALVRPVVALGAAIVLAFGTSMWTVAGTALWSHAPTVLGLAVASWLLAKGRTTASGLGFAIAIFSRPHIAIVAACTGAWLAVARRSWRPLVGIGLTSALGLAALLLWNHANSGRWSVLIGSYGDRLDAAVDVSSSGQGQATLWFADWAATFFSPWRGVFVLMPFLLLLLPGIPSAWRRAPDWVRAGAVSAAVYTVVQLAGNTWTGGTGFFGNRLVLEPLVMLVPLLALAWQEWTSKAAWSRRTFMALVTLTIWWNALAAGAFDPVEAAVRKWSDWEVPGLISAAGAAGLIGATAFTFVAVGVLVFLDAQTSGALKASGRRRRQATGVSD